MTHTRAPTTIAVDQQCFANQLQSLYGNLTAANAIRDIMSVAQTGNLRTPPPPARSSCSSIPSSSNSPPHADLAMYDFGAQQMYVANAAAENESGPVNAFDRQFVQFDLQSLWAEQPPTAGQIASAAAAKRAAAKSLAAAAKP